MFLRRQYDRCDHSLELHVCGRTNSLRVGRTTHSKKRLACETATEMNGKKEKNEEFWTDEGIFDFGIARKIFKICPQENRTMAIHPPTHKYNKNLFKVRKAFRCLKTSDDVGIN